MAPYNFADGKGNLSSLSDVSLILAVIYLAVSAMIFQRWAVVFQSSRGGLDTKKLFVLSVLTTCLLRMASFVGIGVVAWETEDSDDDATDDNATDEELYRMTLLVMFDLPDFIILSAYMLLGLVWGEMMLRSRKHWYSLRENRRPWLFAYLLFNLLLYCTQLLLYSLLFVDAGHVNTDGIVRILYLTLCSINYGLPLAFGLFWLYYNLMFAGFPYQSARAQLNMTKISKAMLVWSLGRILWAGVILTSSLQEYAERSQHLYSVLFVAVFILCEVWPICIALEKDLLYMLMDVTEAVPDSGGSGPGSNSNDHGHEERLLSQDSELDSPIQYENFTYLQPEADAAVSPLTSDLAPHFPPSEASVA